MSWYLLKVLISLLTIIGVTEIARSFSNFRGGVLALLLLTPLLAFLWLCRGVSFPIVLLLSLAAMATAYFLTGAILRRFGVQV